jgi:uncharacterized membrane protein YphA (DoxX/SURF4 family)
MTPKNAPAAAPAPASRRFDALALAARLIVGGLLIYSGSLKAAAPKEEFAVVIEMYDILPSGMAVTAAAFLPWIELLLGWALLLGWQTRAAASAAMGMFATFILAIASTKLRGIDLPNCGCFGGAIHPKPSTTMVVDIVLAGAAFFALKRAPSAPSLDTWAEQPHT